MNFRLLTTVVFVAAWLMWTLQVSAQFRRSFSAVYSTDCKNLCVAGKPAATYSATNQTGWKCALYCIRYPGCAIYNYFEDTNVCELFSCPSNDTSYFHVTAFCKAFMDRAYEPARYSLTDASGYVLYQRRVDFSLVFDQPWAPYKNGFGNICGNFWLGNEQMYRMRVGKSCSLRMEMISTNGTWYTIRYSSFYIDSEAGNYKMHLSGYSGNRSSDPMMIHNGVPFTTSDAMNDPMGNNGYCVATWGGGWWYKGCHDINFNCHEKAFSVLRPTELLKFSQMWVKCI